MGHSDRGEPDPGGIFMKFRQIVTAYTEVIYYEPRVAQIEYF